jgi:hypothetical protein
MRHEQPFIGLHHVLERCNFAPGSRRLIGTF